MSSQDGIAVAIKEVENNLIWMYLDPKLYVKNEFVKGFMRSLPSLL